MGQEILYSDLFLEKALVVNEEGKTALELFTKSLNGKVVSDSSLKLFKPFINSKAAKWSDIILLGDELQVLPHIAGG